MDPYKVLGLSPGASDDEIKKAYRTLAKRYHPDANPGDKTAEQKMKEINAAYDMLINHKYDPASGASTRIFRRRKLQRSVRWVQSLRRQLPHLRPVRLRRLL